MTKWPAAFRCKSRLGTDIGAAPAAAIQMKLIAHTTSVAKKLKEKCSIDTILAIEGIGLKKATKWGEDLGIKNICLQGEGSLGERMKRQLIKIKKGSGILNNSGHKIIIIGSDLPLLSAHDIENGFKELNSHELVIGPSEDGGYWLIGFSEKLLNPITSIPFEGIDWGGDSVLTQTLYKIKKHKVTYKVLNSHNDIDRALDLTPWLSLSQSKIIN